jgi:hypothetical protein
MLILLNSVYSRGKLERQIERTTSRRRPELLLTQTPHDFGSETYEPPQQLLPPGPLPPPSAPSPSLLSAVRTTLKLPHEISMNYLLIGEMMIESEIKIESEIEPEFKSEITNLVE